MDKKEETFGNRETRWLTFLVYILLAFLTFVAGWQQVQVSGLGMKVDLFPKEYVTKERYLTDRYEMTERLKTLGQTMTNRLENIDRKLDRLIERELSKKETGGG